MRSLLQYSWRRVLPAALLLLIVGMTPLYSQSSEQSSNSSNGILTTWETLNSEGLKISRQQKDDLEALRKEITSLKIGSAELTNLYERLSESNKILSIYNQQIAERMQERDIDLAYAYEELNEQDKVILRQKNTILRMGILLGILSLGIIIFLILKLKRKIPVGII